MSEALLSTGDLGSWLWRANWQAGVLAGLILLVLWCAGRRIAPAWRHALLLLVVVRLCLPALPASPVSVFNLWPEMATHGAVSTAERGAKSISQPVTVEFGAIPSIAGADAPEQLNGSGLLLKRHWRSAAIFIWMLGMAILAAAVGISQRRFARRIGDMSAPADDPAVLDLIDRCRREMRVRSVVQVRVCDGVGSPALLGAWRPVVLLPRDMLGLDRDVLRFVLLHELAHVKRRDVLINWLLTAVAVVHWFNPLVHYVIARCRQERELICDQMVLEIVGPSQRRAYGRALVDLFERLVGEPSPALAVGFFSRRSLISRRIQMISMTTSNRRRGSIAAAAIFTALAGATLTDARVSPPRAASAGPAVVSAPQKPALAADRVTIVYDIRDLIDARVASRLGGGGLPAAANSVVVAGDGDAIPILGDLPLLGHFFRRDNMDPIAAVQAPRLSEQAPASGPFAAPDEAAIAGITSLIIERLRAEGGEQPTAEIMIDPRAGSLHASATPGEHRRLAALLSQLRATEQVMVDVEARFMTGLETLIATGDVRLELPAEPNEGRVGVVTLSAREIEIIAGAVTEKDEVSVIASPRLLVFSGQDATVSIMSSTQVALPSADGSGELIDVKVDEGLSTTIRADVAPDRRSITLTLHPVSVSFDLSGPRPVEQRSEAEVTITVPEGGAVLIQLKSEPTALFAARAVRDPRGGGSDPIIVRGAADVPSQPVYLLIRPRLIIGLENEGAAEPADPVDPTAPAEPANPLEPAAPAEPSR